MYAPVEVDVMNGKSSKLLAGVALIAIVAAATSMAGCLGPWFGAANQVNQGAATVVASVANPVVIQAKYHEFQKLKNDIEYYKAEILKWYNAKQALLKTYGSDPSKWNSQVTDQVNDYDFYMQGSISQYNKLVAQYNTGMSEWDYAFCNYDTGRIYGIDGYVALPREYREYITSIADIL
jgi:hypothetical protein